MKHLSSKYLNNPLRQTPKSGDFESSLASDKENLSNGQSATQRDRTRIGEVQLSTLRKAFQIRSYPSREQRLSLAVETGLDFRAITIWFQNQRQTVKRNASAPSIIPRRTSILSSISNIPSRPLAGTSKPIGRSISLNIVASLAEASSHSTQFHTNLHQNCPNSVPATPHRRNSAPSSQELWKYLPSSPVRSPSPSPIRHVERSGFPQPSKKSRSLEWACDQARHSTVNEDDAELTDVELSPHNYPHLPKTLAKQDSMAESDLATEIDEEEVTTPPGGHVFVPISVIPAPSEADTELGRRGGNRDRDDVEAAMLLLGFKART